MILGLSTGAGHLPARVAIGAFILNSGPEKREADEATAARLRGFTAGTYPVAEDIARTVVAGPGSG